MPPASPPDAVVHNRFLGFLIWQSIPSTVIFLLFKTLFYVFTLSTARPPFPFAPWFFAVITFLSFHLSQLLFSASLSLVSSTHPHPHPLVSPLKLSLDLIRFLFVPGSSDFTLSPDSRLRAKLAVRFAAFLAAVAVSGFLAVVSVCGELGDGIWVIGQVGFRGFVMGLLYGLFYVYNRCWVLEFPIIQVSFWLLISVLYSIMLLFLVL